MQASAVLTGTVARYLAPEGSLGFELLLAGETQVPSVP